MIFQNTSDGEHSVTSSANIVDDAVKGLWVLLHCALSVVFLATAIIVKVEESPVLGPPPRS